VHDVSVIDGLENREARERREETVSEGIKDGIMWVATSVAWEVWIKVQ